VSSIRVASLAFITVIASICLAMSTSDFTARGQSTSSLGVDSIIGAWHVTVSFDDGRPNVFALYTFDRDRNFLMDGSWRGLFGSGHGSWNRSTNGNGDSSVDLTFFRLLYSPSETNEATGALNAAFNGTLKVQARLVVGDDGKNFTGRYLLTNSDANGNLRSTATGSFNATLVVVDPLP